MPKRKPAWTEDDDNIPETPDLADELNEVDRELFNDRNARSRERQSPEPDLPNFFTCSSDGTVLKLRGIFKYMHHTGVLATGEHWECPDCGYVCWRYLPPETGPSEFPADFPF